MPKNNHTMYQKDLVLVKNPRNIILGQCRLPFLQILEIAPSWPDHLYHNNIRREIFDFLGLKTTICCSRGACK